MPPLLERAQDRLGHLYLAGPELVIGVRAGDEAAGAEDLFHAAILQQRGVIHTGGIGGRAGRGDPSAGG